MSSTICTEVDHRLDPDTWERTEGVVIDGYVEFDGVLEMWYHHPGEEPFTQRVELNPYAINDGTRQFIRRLQEQSAVVDILMIQEEDRERFGIYAHLCRTDLPPHFITEALVPRAMLGAAA